VARQPYRYYSNVESGPPIRDRQPRFGLALVIPLILHFFRAAIALRNAGGSFARGCHFAHEAPRQSVKAIAKWNLSKDISDCESTCGFFRML
jgi:hypothetical protein